MNRRYERYFDFIKTAVLSEATKAVRTGLIDEGLKLFGKRGADIEKAYKEIAQKVANNEKITNYQKEFLESYEAVQKKKFGGAAATAKRESLLAEREALLKDRKDKYENLYEQQTKSMGGNIGYTDRELANMTPEQAAVRKLTDSEAYAINKDRAQNMPKLKQDAEDTAKMEWEAKKPDSKVSANEKLEYENWANETNSKYQAALAPGGNKTTLKTFTKFDLENLAKRQAAEQQARIAAQNAPKAAPQATQTAQAAPVEEGAISLREEARGAWENYKKRWKEKQEAQQHIQQLV